MISMLSDVSGPLYLSQSASMPPARQANSGGDHSRHRAIHDHRIADRLRAKLITPESPEGPARSGELTMRNITSTRMSARAKDQVVADQAPIHCDPEQADWRIRSPAR